MKFVDPTGLSYTGSDYDTVGSDYKEEKRPERDDREQSGSISGPPIPEQDTPEVEPNTGGGAEGGKTPAYNEFNGFVAKMVWNRASSQLHIAVQITDAQGRSKIIEVTTDMYNNVRPEEKGVISFLDEERLKSEEKHLAAAFPSGKADIIGFHIDEKYGPTIRTNAHQSLEVVVWDSDTDSWVGTGEYKEDYGYNLHGGYLSGNATGANNISDWTDGCGRADNDTLKGLFEEYLPSMKKTGQAQIDVVDTFKDYNWGVFSGPN